VIWRHRTRGLAEASADASIKDLSNGLYRPFALAER
jgi:hypothetical protein